MKPFQIGDLTIPIPIVQGGMGIGVSMSSLASAVANAGGIGTIATVGLGLIYGTPDKNFRQNNVEAAIQEIRKARKQSSGVLAVNIMTVLTNYIDLVETAIAEKIDIIFSGAGLPLDLPKYKTADSKTKLVPIVSSGRAANIIAQKWKSQHDYLPDAIVVEGPLAGGHLGFSLKDLKSGTVTLQNLVKDVLKVTQDLQQKYKKKIPVIAGGGITTGKQIYELFKMGVSAVQLGSRFVATKECDASQEFKDKYVASSEKDIRLIQSPVGLPGRAVENDFLLAAENGERRPKKCSYNCIKSCNPKTTDYCIAEALLAAYQGRFNEGFAFAGANAYKFESISTVDEVFKNLVEEYNAVTD